VNLEPKYAASESDEDLAATRRADAYMNRQYLDPVILGSYPDELREIFGEAWPEHSAEDMKAIRQPIDFVGVNYYTRSVSASDSAALPVRAGGVRQPQHARTETGWEVYPPALTQLLLWVKERYGDLPLYITENGAAFYDPPQAIDGRIEDPLRIWYLREHLSAALEAVRRGVDLRGYFVWSLLDNYEWSLGYAKRFGIIHVNYETLERTLKESARFYSEVIRDNGEALALPTPLSTIARP
jgi:beta-glucosidase